MNRDYSSLEKKNIDITSYVPVGPHPVSALVSLGIWPSYGPDIVLFPNDKELSGFMLYLMREKHIYSKVYFGKSQYHRSIDRSLI